MLKYLLLSQIQYLVSLSLSSLSLYLWARVAGCCGSPATSLPPSIPPALSILGRGVDIVGHHHHKPLIQLIKRHALKKYAASFYYYLFLLISFLMNLALSLSLSFSQNFHLSLIMMKFICHLRLIVAPCGTCLVSVLSATRITIACESIYTICCLCLFFFSSLLFSFLFSIFLI